MTNPKAAQLGARYSLITLSIAIILALLMFAWLDGGSSSLSTKFVSMWEFIQEFAPSFAAALLGLGLSAYGLGRWAGVQILIRKASYIRVGITVALLTLLIGTLSGSTATLLTEVFSDRPYRQAWQLSNLPDDLFDYVVKPLYWVLPFGSIPAIVLGWLYGWRLKKLS